MNSTMNFLTSLGGKPIGSSKYTVRTYKEASRESRWDERRVTSIKGNFAM